MIWQDGTACDIRGGKGQREPSQGRFARRPFVPRGVSRAYASQIGSASSLNENRAVRNEAFVMNPAAGKALR
jgi:hypothetical protein